MTLKDVYINVLLFLKKNFSSMLLLLVFLVKKKKKILAFATKKPEGLNLSVSFTGEETHAC